MIFDKCSFPLLKIKITEAIRLWWFLKSILVTHVWSVSLCSVTLKASYLRVGRGLSGRCSVALNAGNTLMALSLSSKPLLCALSSCTPCAILAVNSGLSWLSGLNHQAAPAAHIASSSSANADCPGLHNKGKLLKRIWNTLSHVVKIPIEEGFWIFSSIFSALSPCMNAFAFGIIRVGWTHGALVYGGSSQWPPHKKVYSGLEDASVLFLLQPNLSVCASEWSMQPEPPQICANTWKKGAEENEITRFFILIGHIKCWALV